MKYSLKKLIIADKTIKKEKPEERKTSITTSSLTVGLIFLVLCVINFVQGDLFMGLCCAFGILYSIISVLLSNFLKKQDVALWVLSICFSLLMTSMLVAGGNNGFACLWIIILPYISMMGYDFRFGFFISLYFLLFLIVFFYTPFGHLLNPDMDTFYDMDFQSRFPILYLASFIVALFLAIAFIINKYRYVEEQIKLKHSEAQLAIKVNELEVEKAKLKVEKELDLLANLYNRSKFEEDKNIRYVNLSSCGVIFLDINNLKQVNDKLGHEYGDLLIKRTANALSNVIKSNVRAYRYGGDEFIVVTKNLTVEENLDIVEKIKYELDVLNKSANNDLICSISIGSSFQKDNIDLDELLKLADYNMYIDKRNNKIER